MKKLILSAFGLASILGVYSCSEDFEVTAPYKDVTVAYGVLNRADTAHYIRIEKAFLDEHKSALEMAKIADSSFYSQLDVKIKEFSNNNLISTTPLTRVDLNNEGYPKAPGAFFTAPNYAYKFKKALNPAYSYRLVITNTVTGQVDSASTAVLNDDKSAFYVSQFNQLGYSISFVSSNPNLKTFTWTPVVPPNTGYRQATIRFRWVDKNPLTGVQTDHYADWTFATKTMDDGGGLNMETSYDQFFSFLSDAMGPAPTNIERYMDSCDLFVWAADTAYYKYNKYLSSQGGITADEIKLSYTNFHSNQSTRTVLGVLGSRALRFEPNVPINDASLAALKTNSVTAPLNIKGRSDH